VARAAKILQIEPLLDRKPAALSGGQRQRVAIGRALVRDVDVFLFDEPLSNLDAKLRADLRVEIKRLHQQLSNTMIYVTHDQVEAMTLADRIAVMRGGRVLQLATPDEIYNRPANRYVADFIGSPSMNFVEGAWQGGAFRAEGLTLPLAGAQLSAPQVADRPATLGIRPEHVATGRMAEHAPWRGEVVVDLVEPMGSDTLVWAKLAGQPFRVRMDGQAQVAPGDRVAIGLDPARASVFDQKTEERL
jgi:multiple sugar transport system ATP-binding protein